MRGREFGVIIGRKRRCGWLDFVLFKYVYMINGFIAWVFLEAFILGNNRIVYGYRLNFVECKFEVVL